MRGQLVPVDAPGARHRQLGVGIREAREDGATAPVDPLRSRVARDDLGRGTNSSDQIALDQDRGLVVDGLGDVALTTVVSCMSMAMTDSSDALEAGERTNAGRPDRRASPGLPAHPPMPAVRRRCGAGSARSPTSWRSGTQSTGLVTLATRLRESTRLIVSPIAVYSSLCAEPMSLPPRRRCRCRCHSAARSRMPGESRRNLSELPWNPRAVRTARTAWSD